MERARVLLADDHRLVAEGLRGLLEPEFELVDIVEDGRELVDRARELLPDVIVADISMPLLNGLEAIQQLKKMDGSVKVVVLTMHQDVSYAMKAFEVGACGFVLKHSAPMELVTAIREAWAGRSYVTPLIADELKQAYRLDTAHQLCETMVELTPRQRKVLQLFADGSSAKEVAAILNISLHTAEVFKAIVMHLLDVHTTAELTEYAVQHGYISA
jgi:DNA-binding NarL/FixJ family response regulator